MGFTSEQQQAVDARGSHLLVAAAAGSGKTTVLVERIIQIVTNKEKPVDVDRLLVVTFTDAAAAEMRQRISAAIDRELDKDPTNEHLARQATLLNMAHISTIHSFCSWLIKSYFHMIDLDPGYKVAEQTETALIKAQVMEELLEEEYARPDNLLFYDLVESYGGGKTRDDSLETLIFNLHDFIESSPFPEDCMQKYVRVYQDACELGLDATPWADILKDELRIKLDGAMDTIHTAMDICRQPGGPERYLDALQSDMLTLQELAGLLDGSLQDILEGFESLSFQRIYTYRGKSDVSDELKNLVKDIRNKEIKDRLKKIKSDFFFRPIEDMARDIEELLPVVTCLAGLVLRFREKYSDAKKQKNIADFNDLEHYAIEILTTGTGDSASPSGAAIELREKFVEVLMDEYQDVNPVQELILSTLSGNSRFMVGDIKQSIYKFRRAKPELFIEKYESYAHWASPSSGNVPGYKIDLSKNFRSRKIIIDTVNFFFRQLMSADMGDVTYNQNAALYAGAEFPKADDLRLSCVTDIHLIGYGSAYVPAANPAAPSDVPPMQSDAPSSDKGIDNEDGAASDADETEDPLLELTKAEWEAELIAREIKSLTSGGNRLYILDNGEYRPCRYRDIVILTRSVSSTAEALTETLKRHGIPVYADMSTGFFQALEVMTVLSFLQVIDNPLQDIHLITVLHSPVYDLNADALLAIRKSGEGSFFNCVRRYASEETGVQATRETLAAFLHDLSRWRKLAVYTPIHQLIEILYDDTHYFHYAAALPDGAVRQANLRALVERAIAYENTSFKGLFHFVRYIERLRQTGADLGGSAAVLPDHDDLVRVMTIHKSKGLEFPVVFVSMLGRGFNRSDERRSVIMHQDYGIGPKYVNPGKRTRANTLAHTALALQVHKESLSEELRVLYVAMTRAKEKLILTGCHRKLDKLCAKWSRYASDPSPILPLHYTLSAATVMDWLMPCVARHSDGWPLSAYVGAESVHSPLAIASVASGHTLASTEARFRLTLHNQDELEGWRAQNEKLAIDFQKKLDEIKSEPVPPEIDAKLSWAYPYSFEEKLPTKVSISEIKRIYYNEMLTDSEKHPAVYEKPTFPKPVFLDQEAPSDMLKRGTAMHTVVEHIDIHESWDAERITKLIDRLVSQNILEPADAEAVSVSKILRFTQSELAERMRRADIVKKETAFVMGLSPSEIYPSGSYDGSDETILVHGIVDCYFEENGEMVIVDYKSDYTTPNTIDEIKDRYRIQLSIYKKAVEKSTGKNVKATLLYLFALDEAIPL